MARTSRNQRKKQRTKRNNSVLKREVKQSALASYKLFSTFMMVLAQKGGEVTITKGTAEQVWAELSRLAYVVEPGATENEFIIRQTLKEDTSSTTENIPSQGENIGYHDTMDNSAAAIADSTLEP